MSAARRSTISRSAPSARRRPRITSKPSESRPTRCRPSATARSSRFARTRRMLGTKPSRSLCRPANQRLTELRMLDNRKPGLASSGCSRSRLAPGCADQADMDQLTQNEHLRGMIASDRQQIDALKAQVARHNDHIDELQHSGAAADSSSPRAERSHRELECEVNARSNAPSRCSGRAGLPALFRCSGRSGRGARCLPARRKRLCPPGRSAAPARVKPGGGRAPARRGDRAGTMAGARSGTRDLEPDGAGLTDLSRRPRCDESRQVSAGDHQVPGSSKPYPNRR